jgi:hypothetical protein
MSRFIPAHIQTPQGITFWSPDLNLYLQTLIYQTYIKPSSVIFPSYDILPQNSHPSLQSFSSIAYLPFTKPRVDFVRRGTAVYTWYVVLILNAQLFLQSQFVLYREQRSNVSSASVCTLQRKTLNCFFNLRLYFTENNAQLFLQPQFVLCREQSRNTAASGVSSHTSQTTWHCGKHGTYKGRYT